MVYEKDIHEMWVKMMERFHDVRVCEMAGDPNFGKRLAKLRKMAGYTQLALAEELGMSQRMLSHYESGATYIPLEFLPKLAKALGVSTDQLLGVPQDEADIQPRNVHFWKKLKMAEHLPASDRKSLLNVLEGLLAKNG